MVTLLFSETFEEGTPGTAITTSDSNFTNFVAAGTWVFSNAHLVPGYGSMSGKSTASAGTAIANAGNSAWPLSPVTFWDKAFHVVSAPTSNASIVTARNGAAATADLRALATGAVQLRVNNIQVAVSGTGYVVTGKKVRVRFKLDSTAQKVQLEVWGDANISAATPDYDSGLIPVSSLTATTNFQLGLVSSTTGSLEWGGFAVASDGYPGPTSNTPPTCSASASPSPAAAGATVTLSGTDSDPDGTIATRAWTQTSGTTVTLAGASSAAATFTAPSVSGGTTLRFAYTVTDNAGATSTATVTVPVLSSTATAAFRASAQATNTGSGATTSVTIPTTGPGGAVAAGDKALLFFFDGGGNLTQTLTAAGWQALGSAVSTSNIGIRIWQKTIVAGDPGATLTVTSSVDGSTIYKRTMSLVIYSGSRVGNASAQLSTAAGTAHTAPGQASVSANAWVVNAFADRGSPGSSAIGLPGNLTSRLSFAHAGGAAVTSIIADDDLVGSGTVGANVGTGTLSTANAVQATVILEPGTPNNPPPTVNAGTDLTDVEPWSTFSAGGADTYFGTATASSIVWTQTGGADLGVDLSTYTTATITLEAPATLYGTTVELTKTVTDSLGGVGVDIMQAVILPATERFVSAAGVEVPIRSYWVTA